MTRRPHFPWPFPAAAALRPAASPAPAAPVDMEPQDETQSPYCGCDLPLTLPEVMSGKCATCGKAILG